MGKKKHHWSAIPADHPYVDDIGTWITLRLIQVQDDQRALILVAHGYIELLVSSIVKACCKNGAKIAKNDQAFPHSSKLVILHEMGLIEDADFLRLDCLRKIRNSIAHEPFFEITEENLSQLGIEASDELEGFLIDTISCITARHLDVLAPVVLPHMIYPADVKYRKCYAALSHKWVDVLFPLIQEHGWTCQHCGTRGKNFGESRPPQERSYNNPSYVFCRECSGNIAIPEELIKKHCGEEPEIVHGDKECTAHIELFQMPSMRKIDLGENSREADDEQ